MKGRVPSTKSRIRNIQISKSELNLVNTLKNLNLNVVTQYQLILDEIGHKRYLDSYFELGQFKFNIEIDGDYYHNVLLDFYKDIEIYNKYDILTIRINDEAFRKLKDPEIKIVELITWHILHGSYFKTFNTTRRIYDYKWLLGDLKLITLQH